MINIMIWNIQHWNIEMTDSRKLCKNKNYFNHNSINGIFVIVYTIVLMFPTHGTSLETMSNKIRCSDSMTCTKCTLTPGCVWSLKTQECGHKNQFNSSSLILSSECPQFSMVTTTYQYFKTYIHVSNVLKITNDLVGFKKYLLEDTNMYYGLQNTFEDKIRVHNKTIIWLSLQKKKSTFDVKMPTVTYFMFIKFNGIMLRFDNVTDHYFTFYKHKECATNETNKYKSCVTCGWNKNGNSNYLKWCSSENTCEVNNLYMKNNATHQLNENVAYVTNDCAEINVTAVDPLYGPQTGGTTVTIIVKNHWIFVEGRNLKVTVAGTVCTNLKTFRLETITCTTSEMVGALSGPILVEYSSFESGLKIESSQIFQFCPNPVLDEDQQLGGVASGGTSVLVRGSHFAEPCVVSSARLYVNLSDGVRRYADSYCDPPINDTCMVCRSPRVNGTSWDGDSSVVGRLLNFGLDITFRKQDYSLNQSLPITVRGSSLRFYIYPDPILLDFEIDVSGSVVVNGLNLEHYQPEDIVIWSVDSPTSVCEVVTVTRHSWVCVPTTSFNVSQVVSVTLANSLVFTVIRKTSHRPDNPFIPLGCCLVIISTVLAFTFYLTRKYRYETKNIRKPPEAYIRSRPYTAL